MTGTPVHRIHSEASIGKAYLKAMRVRPWREVQPDVPPRLLATILSTYYGGRSEVRIRRELREVIPCDFVSHYPTVCTSQGIWPFVIAERANWREATDEVRTFAEGVTLETLQRPETWRKLTALVQL